MASAMLLERRTSTLDTPSAAPQPLTYPRPDENTPSMRLALTFPRQDENPASMPRARWATVRVETEGAVYVGRVYVAETRRKLSDVLSDDCMFINLTEVQVNDADMVEPFIAVNKQYIRTIRVLSDGEPALRMVVPAR